MENDFAAEKYGFEEGLTVSRVILAKWIDKKKKIIIITNSEKTISSSLNFTDPIWSDQNKKEKRKKGNNSRKKERMTILWNNVETFVQIVCVYI